MTGKLVEIKDLGMQVNKFNTEELIDSCILSFEYKGQIFETYPLPKTYRKNSKLGKFISILKGSAVTDEDLDESGLYDCSELLHTKAVIEIDDNKRVIRLYKTR